MGNDVTPFIQITVPDNVNCTTALTPLNGKVSNKYNFSGMSFTHQNFFQIHMSEIDFWAEGLTSHVMKTKQDARSYPPRCHLNVSLKHGIQSTSLNVRVNGCTKHESLDMGLLISQSK